MRYPGKLEAGATVGLICPSSPISEDRMEKCINAIQQLGYKVKAADNLTENYAGFMAGDGEVRAKWINAMFADPEVDAIFCVRGGYAGNRAMEYLDLDTIRANPKIFVGYSDVTSMHIAINKCCGLVTFHGPMVSSNIVDKFDDLTRESFLTALRAEASFEFKNPDEHEIKVLREGKASGELTGGNLAILTASIGTPYEVDTKGKILFIEEVGETISRIDRMLYQLRNSGKLRDCAGIILGQFTDCPNEEVPQYTEIECLNDILRDIDVPVMYNIQSGHDHPMMTLPLGAVCTMDTFSRTIVFEAPER